MTVAPSTQRAIAALAGDAIAVGADGRLPTNLEYQQSLGVGAGTVQQAVRVLEPPGSLELYGLMDALRDHLGRLRVPFTIAHRQGGHRRVELISSGDADA